MSIERRQHGIAARLATCVWPDLDAELRRLTLENTSDAERRIEVTAYAPLVLNQAPAHAADPAFSKLFVQTEHLIERRALLARRRPRGTGEHPPLMALLWPDGGAYALETDRARFLGRNRTGVRAAAFDATALSGTVGSVLDPAFAVRETIVLPAKGAARPCSRPRRNATVAGVGRCLRLVSAPRYCRGRECGRSPARGGGGLARRPPHRCRSRGAALRTGAPGA